MTGYAAHDRGLMAGRDGGAGSRLPAREPHLRHTGCAAVLRAALGVACGVATWGMAGFFGIHTLFVVAPWLYLVLKVGGGTYLLYLGFRLFWGSSKPAAPKEAAPLRSQGGAFRLGLLTNISNPKAPLFVSSLFAATLPQHPPTVLGIAAVAVMFAIGFGWMALVAQLLTIRSVSQFFKRIGHWIDRAAGLAFMGLGPRLLLDRSA